MMMPIPLEASIREGAKAAAHDLHARMLRRRLRHSLCSRRHPKLTPDAIQDIIMRAMHSAKDYR